MALYRAFATVGGLTLVSRLLGFVRDVLIAAVLGTGAVADAFLVAFRLPNLFRRIFAEGAFNSAFVPLFAKTLEADGVHGARRFAEEAQAGLAYVIVLLSIVAIGGMGFILVVLAPGYLDQPEKFDLSVLLAQIAFPYLLCISLVALYSGVLSSLGRFAAAAGVQILLNVVMPIAVGAAYLMGLAGTPQAGVMLAVGVAVAGLVQLLAIMLFAARAGMLLGLRWPRYTPDMRRLVTLGIPAVITGGVTQINIAVGTSIASLQDGAVSFLYYADRLYQLPLGIVGIAIGIVLLPDIARQLAAGNLAGVARSQNRSTEFALLLTVPASVALAVVPVPIISVLFERGAFTAEATPPTAYALAAFAIGLPAFVLSRVLSPVYFAREDTRTPMRYATINMVVNVVLSLVLFFTFQAYGLMPHVGIAIATTVAGWINALQLWGTLWLRGDFIADARLVRTLPMIVASSVVMGVVLWAAHGALAPWLVNSQPTLVRLGALGALITAGMVSYAVLVVATGVFRLADIRAMAKARREARGGDAPPAGLGGDV